MDSAEYRHVVLELIFLKYISDSFDKTHPEIEKDPEGLSDPEDIDEYKSRNVFWVGPECYGKLVNVRFDKFTKPQAIDRYPVLKSVCDPTLHRHISTVLFVLFLDAGPDITNE